MQGLISDGWFYLSFASLFVSGTLFFFLLGQYRAAVEAADRPEGEADAHAESPAASAVRPVYVSDDSASNAKVASAPSGRLAEKVSSPEVEPAPAGAPFEGHERRRENLTGGSSPAVLYLQSIKSQLDVLNGSVAELSRRVDSISGRDEALIERFGELSAAVAELKDAVTLASCSGAAAEAVPAPSAERAPAPDPAEAAEDVPSAAPVETPHVNPAPAPKMETNPDPNFERTFSLKSAARTGEKASSPVPDIPAAKPAPAGDESIRLELDELIETQLAAKTSRRAPSPSAVVELSPVSESAAVSVESTPEAAAVPAPTPAKEQTAPVVEAAPAEPEDKPRRGPVWPV